METRDWALVVFTLLTQAAVGAFLTLEVLDRLGTQPRDGGLGRAGAGSRLVVLGVFCAGLFAALFHLSAPLEAVRAVVNISSSWLSREIIFGSLFAALLVTIEGMEWSSAGAWRERRWLVPITVVAGLAFLYSQIMIYLMPSQPAWNSLATPAAFVGTTLSLGILGVSVGEALRLAKPPATCLRGLAFAGVVVLIAELAVVSLHLVSLLDSEVPAAALSGQRLADDYGIVLLLRLGLLGMAVAALGGVLVCTKGPRGYRLARALTYAAFAQVVLSELCGRFLFYAMQVRVGI